ncbi:MAG: hypothetical protein ACK5LO_01130 [Leucobacter sp.]
MSTPAPAAQPSSFAKAIGLALAAAAVVCVVLLAFAWPSITSKPHDIPVGIVGSAEQVSQVEDQLAEQSDGAVDLEVHDDRDAAVAAIEQREIYGALVLGESSGTSMTAPEMLIATAANSAVAQMLQGMATGMQAQLTTQVNTGVEQQVQQLIDALRAVQSGQAPTAPAGEAPAAEAAPATQLPDTFTMPDAQVTVTDVVPLSEDDPRGAGLSAAALPLVMGGMIGAMIISTAIHGSRRRLVALIVYTVVAGLALTAILEGWFGALQNNYWANALAITLSIGAISATIVGLRSVLGYAGLGIGAVLMFFFANPISGSALPPEFLIGSWGAIGQWFPPGAGQTLIRTLSYFPDASTLFPWLVLTGWTLFGLILIWIGSLKKPARVESEGVADQKAPAALGEHA